MQEEWLVVDYSVLIQVAPLLNPILPSTGDKDPITVCTTGDEHIDLILINCSRHIGVNLS